MIDIPSAGETSRGRGAALPSVGARIAMGAVDLRTAGGEDTADYFTSARNSQANSHIRIQEQHRRSILNARNLIRQSKNKSFQQQHQSSSSGLREKKNRTVAFRALGTKPAIARDSSVQPRQKSKLNISLRMIDPFPCLELSDITSGATPISTTFQHTYLRKAPRAR